MQVYGAACNAHLAFVFGLQLKIWRQKGQPVPAGSLAPPPPPIMGSGFPAAQPGDGSQRCPLPACLLAEPFQACIAVLSVLHCSGGLQYSQAIVQGGCNFIVVFKRGREIDLQTGNVKHRVDGSLGFIHRVEL